MKVALVGPMDSPVSEDASGGTEIWTYNFAQQLVERGVDVSVYALSESYFSGRLISIASQKDILQKDGSISKTRHIFFSLKEMAQVVRDQSNYDLIHISVFSLIFYLPLINLINKPIVVTLHGFPFGGDDAEVILPQVSKINFVIISNFFLKKWAKPKKYRVIRHGIDLNDFIYSEKSKDYFFWMNRISPEKGLEDAIEAALRTNSSLIVSGPIRDQDYFERILRPHLGKNILYAGPLGLKEKVNYYQGAKAFLMPIKWEEPFGLVVVEAMACGTPVIAYGRGAIPEIISDKSDGLIIKPDSIDGMVRAMKDVSSISRKSCRKKAEQKFSIDRMVDEYLDYYKQILA